MTVFDYTLTMLRLSAEKVYTWPVSPAEAGAVVEEVERLRAEVAELRALGVSLHKAAAAGRDAERAAVVAWLRAAPTARMWQQAPMDDAADHIERGEHRREEE